MFWSKTRSAISGWDAEVDEETARLIEEGEAPYVAMMRAAENVRRRRRAEHGKRDVIPLTIGDDR